MSVLQGDRIETYAKIVADSVSPLGVRLTSIEVQFPRFVLPQLLMHRQWSRSCESSRARPFKSKSGEVGDDPVVPSFALNRKGMSAGDSLPPEVQEDARGVWLGAMEEMMHAAERLHQLGVAKQWVNRLLEPFAYQKVLITGTDFANFFRLRCADDAQPEIQELAVKMRAARWASVPKTLHPAQWHLPYYDFDVDAAGLTEGGELECLRVSAARCARISYCNHEGKRDLRMDLDLADTLQASGHSNVFEHQCTPAPNKWRYGNLRGWVSYRHKLEQFGKLPHAEG